MERLLIGLVVVGGIGGLAGIAVYSAPPAKKAPAIELASADDAPAPAEKKPVAEKKPEPPKAAPAEKKPAAPEASKKPAAGGKPAADAANKPAAETDPPLKVPAGHFGDPQKMFTVWFPSAPDRSVALLSMGAGIGHRVRYATEFGIGTHLSVTSEDAGRTWLRMERHAALASIEQAVMERQKKSYTVTNVRAAPVNQGKHIGREVSANYCKPNDPKNVLAWKFRIFIAGGCFYLVDAYGPAEVVNGKTGTSFLDSFQFTAHADGVKK